MEGLAQQKSGLPISLDRLGNATVISIGSQRERERDEDCSRSAHGPRINYVREGAKNGPIFAPQARFAKDKGREGKGREGRGVNWLACMHSQREKNADAALVLRRQRQQQQQQQERHRHRQQRRGRSCGSSSADQRSSAGWSWKGEGRRRRRKRKRKARQSSGGEKMMSA
ncbi:hypothetical protein AXG93_1543s1060 [Marchantia polymorpha subsp. ruderalis]|uniref:Uncharacterized protein n=1 Tax=Marchantia polymorpha subsp. ruderalis TaxID=1480154 RepID=A0A176VYP6_MARPO|nr:hypothetical protein AXG93_1543s1060 [Marchantia polymorpha subsp. ruderalis]